MHCARCKRDSKRRFRVGKFWTCKHCGATNDGPERIREREARELERLDKLAERRKGRRGIAAATAIDGPPALAVVPPGEPVVTAPKTAPGAKKARTPAQIAATERMRAGAAARSAAAAGTPPATPKPKTRAVMPAAPAPTQAGTPPAPVAPTSPAPSQRRRFGLRSVLSGDWEKAS